MKITKINVWQNAVKLLHPVTISLGTVSESISAFVEIETDAGLVGYGEGSPGILITGETLAGTVECIKMFEQVLIGVDPTNLEKIHALMNSVAAHAGAAKAAIDIACYDLFGKKAGLPVYQLLGGYSTEVETDMTIGINEPLVMQQAAKAAVEQGFDTLKIKVGLGMEADLARVQAIREAVGFDIKLRLDANQGWQPKQALAMIEQLKAYDIELIEQPIPYYNINGLAYVRANSPIPIMSDESCFDSKDALHLVSQQAVDIVNIKLMKCGGLYEAVKINSICEAAGIECMLGCMIEESTIGVTAAAHLVAAKKNITRADLDATFALETSPFSGGVPTTPQRILKLGTNPGLGLTKVEG